MDKQKDSIYLATIARAINRFGIAASNQDLLCELQQLTVEGEKDFSRLIDEAELLASGVSSKEILERIPNVMMESLLESIGNNKKGSHGVIPKFIALDKTVFPTKKHNNQTNLSHLANRLCDNIKHIQKANPRVMAENMLQLLFRYTSSVPANDKNLDISLFDQTRVAAAIAVCLYELRKKDEKSSSKPFLLIGADFSGIQSYIYQIVSKHAGKNLKGRSFYLRLLSDAVVGYLLKELNLYNANIIYDSGGCFYLLAPNTTNLKDTLSSAIQHVEKQLFISHGTSLFVAIDSV